jgi:hypothetical protein
MPVLARTPCRRLQTRAAACSFGRSDTVRRYILALLVLVCLGPLLGAAPGRAAAPAAQPAWKRLTYGSASFEVPASWPVYNLASEPSRCARLDVHAVYLGSQGEEASCPAGAVGRTEALQIAPLQEQGTTAAMTTQATTVGGQLAYTDPLMDVQNALVVSLDRAGLLLTATYNADPGLARQIVASVRQPGAGASGGAGASAATARVQAQATAVAVATTPKIFSGKGFDTCAAPSTKSMAAWRKSSPYRAIGIYIGGAQRACGDGNLSRSWVSTVTRMGWRLIPIYVGLQAPCSSRPNLSHIKPKKAAAQGAQAGADAVARASRVFGLGRGTPIFFDMEHYNRKKAKCARAVLKFLSGWTQELHRHRYGAGVYSSASSGVTDLVSSYDSGSLERPDYIWFAHWNGKATTSDGSLPSSMWRSHRRIGQYRGGHTEHYNRVTLNIDNDQIDSVLVSPR